MKKSKGKHVVEATLASTPRLSGTEKSSGSCGTVVCEACSKETSVLLLLLLPPCQVVQGYIESLLQREAYEEAARLSPRLLKDNAGMWERWAYLFAQTRQLPKLAPYIPTGGGEGGGGGKEVKEWRKINLPHCGPPSPLPPALPHGPDLPRRSLPGSTFSTHPPTTDPPFLPRCPLSRLRSPPFEGDCIRDGAALTAGVARGPRPAAGTGRGGRMGWGEGAGQSRWCSAHCWCPQRTTPCCWNW